MRQLLKLHPDSHSNAVTQIEVDVARPRAGHLMLSYSLTGKLRDVLMPPAATSTRGDGLWRHTCFEAFVRPAAGAAYYEFNFAPSTRWAAYRFGNYRNGMSAAMDIGVSIVDVQSGADCYSLRAALDFDRISDLSGHVGWHLGLAAAIEDVGHRMSYWALAHPPGKPDFHHDDCFVHELILAVAP